MKKRFFAALFAMTLASAAGSPRARAYEEERSEYGARLRWSSFPARVRVTAPVPGFSNAALLRAIKTWSSVECSSLGFVEAQAGEDALIEVRAVREGWAWGDMIGAHTKVDSDPFTGEIKRVTIEIDAKRKWSDEEGVPKDALDLETVFLHELGHAAGLAHSHDPSAIMRAGLKPGHAPRRTLAPDDLAGICAAHPKNPPPPPVKPDRLAKTNSFHFSFVLAGIASIAALGLAISRLRSRPRPGSRPGRATPPSPPPR